MCGRFTLIRPNAEVAEAFGLTALPEREPRYNIAPTQQVLAVRQAASHREATLFRWGLVPAWSNSLTVGAPLINARADTVAIKPAFRNAYRKRRCLIPADGFYEWKAEGRAKVPHLFTLRGGLFAIAGLWETWDGGGERVESACMITTEANAVVRVAHDRMPVILPREAWEAWLNPTTEVQALSQLLRPFSAVEMSGRAVSSAVNSARSEGPECVETAPARRQASLFG